MKKIISLVCAVGFSLTSFATGFMSLNSPQSGFLYYTNGGPTAITNTFATGFSYTPAFASYLISPVTNALPLTNVVTATNFIVYISPGNVGTGTNATVAWTAVPVATRMQYGTIVAGSGTATGATNTFAQPFVSAPSVVVSGSLLGSATNNYVVVSTVSATGFAVSTGATNQTIYWQAIGPCASRAFTGPNGDAGVITY